MSDYAIEITGLTKHFGKKVAVDSLDLRIPKGSVVGLLGRNGSGKSTTIKMLMGLLKPSRGRAMVLGRDAQEIEPATRARIGYIPEGHPLYEWMCIRAAGNFFASFYQRPKQRWSQSVFTGLIDYFELDPESLIKTLSRGQRAQVSLALVLAQQPDLLVMDDPTLGLDPVVRRELLESLVELIHGGDRTVLFSSHQLGDVERVADRIAILDHGVLRADCSVDIFRAKIKRVHLRFSGEPPPEFDVPGIVRRADRGQEVTLTIANFEKSVLAQLQKTNPESTQVEDLGLEDAFVDYTSGKRRTQLSQIAFGGAVPESIDATPSSAS